MASCTLCWIQFHSCSEQTSCNQWGKSISTHLICIYFIWTTISMIKASSNSVIISIISLLFQDCFQNVCIHCLEKGRMHCWKGCVLYHGLDWKHLASQMSESETNSVTVLCYLKVNFKNFQWRIVAFVFNVFI